MNNTTDAMSICPYKKLINWSIRDNLDKLFTKYGIHVNAKTAAKVSIPDIIGDSVILDANTPIEIYVHDNSIKPNIDVKKIGILGTSKKQRIPKYIKVHKTGIKISIIADKNLATTTPSIPTGDVNRSWSVPDFLSPEKVHIVKSGVINIKPYSAV